MRKPILNKPPKKRAKKYEPKVKFGGTFEEMVAIAGRGAGVKMNQTKNKK